MLIASTKRSDFTMNPPPPSTRSSSFATPDLSTCSPAPSLSIPTLRRAIELSLRIIHAQARKICRELGLRRELGVWVEGHTCSDPPRSARQRELVTSTSFFSCSRVRLRQDRAAPSGYVADRRADGSGMRWTRRAHVAWRGVGIAWWVHDILLSAGRTLWWVKSTAMQDIVLGREGVEVWRTVAPGASGAKAANARASSARSSLEPQYYISTGHGDTGRSGSSVQHFVSMQSISNSSGPEWYRVARSVPNTP